jgi:hypothetical protein
MIKICCPLLEWTGEITTKKRCGLFGNKMQEKCDLVRTPWPFSPTQVLYVALHFLCQEPCRLCCILRLRGSYEDAFWLRDRDFS